MSEANQQVKWSYWAIAIAAVLWNAIGCLDFVMTMTRNEEYLAGFTPEQLEFFFAFPGWMIVVWAVGVWGAEIASILLLFRSKLAYPIYLASFVAVIISTLRNFVFADGMNVIGDIGSLVLTTLILVIALALMLYSKSLTSKGILR